jgi:hypothetical protein
MKIMNQEVLEEIEINLTKQLKESEAQILEICGSVLDRDNYTFQMFNGKFGGKNNIYVSSVYDQFVDFQDFYSRWLEGCLNEHRDRINSGHKYSVIHTAVVLKNEEVRNYVKLFLERNFYRNLVERTRRKPLQSHWDIWFGGKMIYGLLIAPKYFPTSKEWGIDKSHIRRASYKYWTISHVKETGFIDPDANAPLLFKTSESFYQFYISVLKKISVSKYEQQFYDRYIAYLKKSTDLLSEPLLIPEIRFEGLTVKHKHRLDFVVLNSHTFEYVGFEISPSSTHMKVAKLKEKQKVVNEELSVSWTKEMDKRNKYYEKFGITIVTFTDHMLLDMDACWKKVEIILSKRNLSATTEDEQLERLLNL